MGSQVHDLLLENQLLQENTELYVGDGFVDFQGRPVLKSKTGHWRANFFIIGNECAECLAYYGIATNLVSYLSSKLHEGMTLLQEMLPPGPAHVTLHRLLELS